MKYTKSCVHHVKFPEPVSPMDFYLSTELPYEARITEIVVRYKTIFREDMIAEFNARDLKRHDAAVKANVTRKHKKGEAKAAPQNHTTT